MAEVKKQNNYTAEDIYVLEGLEPVRRRPGMYIGSTGADGLHHLIWEVVDNSLDEAMAGYAKNIAVTLLPDSEVRVVDDGRGIPVERHAQTKKSALETVMTTLHAGAKFGGKSYKIAGGLHGVGVSVVNALSENLRADVCRDGVQWTQEYSRGKAKTTVKKTGTCEGSGTAVSFMPDKKIFEQKNGSLPQFEWHKILTHLRQQAYLTPRVRIAVFDNHSRNSSDHTSYTFYFEGGLRSYVAYLNRRFRSQHQNIFYVSQEVESVHVEIAMQYTDDLQSREMSFANNIYTVEGGTHLTGFRTALTRTLNDHARKNGYVKEGDENLTGDDVREGLTAVISVKIIEPQFEGQTKAKLGNTEARGVVETVLSSALASFLDEHPSDTKAILGKVMLARQARVAAKAAKETVLRKGVLEGLSLPGKLADCQSRDASESELFIVEGDSAGGSAKQGRNRKFQAILPLKGKILNVEKARIDKMLASKEIRSLIIALGTAIAHEFDISKLRYHKIIIMTDADVDGSHIRTLLLTLFFRYYREVIIQGHLYIAKPPLYQIKKGKEMQYAYSEEEKAKALKEFGEDVNIQRYKGLGEMNPEQLWETTMDPEHRTLKQVSIDDAQEADSMFEVLMGSDVAPRKRFIQTHAASVQNLDV